MIIQYVTQRSFFQRTEITFAPFVGILKAPTHLEYASIIGYSFLSFASYDYIHTVCVNRFSATNAKDGNISCANTRKSSTLMQASLAHFVNNSFMYSRCISLNEIFELSLIVTQVWIEFSIRKHWNISLRFLGTS